MTNSMSFGKFRGARKWQAPLALSTSADRWQIPFNLKVSNSGTRRRSPRIWKINNYSEFDEDGNRWTGEGRWWRLACEWRTELQKELGKNVPNERIFRGSSKGKFSNRRSGNFRRILTKRLNFFEVPLWSPNVELLLAYPNKELKSSGLIVFIIDTTLVVVWVMVVG